MKRLLYCWLVAVAACGHGEPVDVDHAHGPSFRSTGSPAFQAPLPHWPWEGVEYLAQLSYRPSSPADAVRVLADAGAGHLRVLTVLSRWGFDEVPPEPGWWVDPRRDRAEWLERRDDLIHAGGKYGVYIILCLFDEPTRWDRTEVRDALWREGVDPRFAGTWLGRDVSEEAAIELAAWWLEGVEPRPWLIVETSNEPQDIPGMPEDALEDWLEARGFIVSRNTEIGRDGPYGSPAYLWEHAWGRPGVAQPWPPLERLRSLRAVDAVAEEGARTSAVRLGLSTDGFGYEDSPEAAIRGRVVLDLGYGYSVLWRTAPDLLVPRDVLLRLGR